MDEVTNNQSLRYYGAGLDFYLEYTERKYWTPEILNRKKQQNLDMTQMYGFREKKGLKMIPYGVESGPWGCFQPQT